MSSATVIYKHSRNCSGKNQKKQQQNTSVLLSDSNQYIPLMFTHRIQYIIYECLPTNSGPDWNQLSTGKQITAWVYGEEAERYSVNIFYPTHWTVLSKQFLPNTLNCAQ